MVNEIVIEERLGTKEVAWLLGLGLLGTLLRRRRNRASRVGRAVERGRWVARLVAVPVILGLLWLARSVIVRVVETPDGRQLDIAYGPNGVVRQSFPARDILGASVGEVRVGRWGGLGYRGSLRLFKRAALVTRHGEALELELTRGRRFLVTVDEPGAFASALSA